MLLIEMSRETAISLAATEFWVGLTDEQIFVLQLHTRRSILPFGRFHEATEETLQRSVFTHEYAYPDFLWADYRGEVTVQSVYELIPEEFRVSITIREGELLSAEKTP